MRRSYHDREADYRRRLRLITPVVVVLLLALLYSTKNVPYEVIEQRLGWEGATRLMPEITIIPDTDPFEDISQESRRRATAAIEIEEWEETGPAEGARRQDKPEEKPEEKVAPDLTEEFVRHYPAHTEIPYSEDYVILHMVKPEYPRDELDQGIEGEVTLELLVSNAGAVENAWVLSANGPQSFEAASLDAVRQFRFKPPIVNGRPTEMWIRFQIRFRIMS